MSFQNLYMAIDIWCVNCYFVDHNDQDVLLIDRTLKWYPDNPGPWQVPGGERAERNGGAACGADAACPALRRPPHPQGPLRHGRLGPRAYRGTAVMALSFSSLSLSVSRFACCVL